MFITLSQVGKSTARGHKWPTNPIIRWLTRPLPATRKWADFRRCTSGTRNRNSREKSRNLHDSSDYFRLVWNCRVGSAEKRRLGTVHAI